MASNKEAAQVLRACERLRVPLTRMVGAAGFASLFSRALVLAKRRTPALNGASIEPDGSLSGFAGSGTNAKNGEDLRRGGKVLIEEVLNLLVAFIGESLTLSLLGEAIDKTAPEKTDRSIEETR